MRFCDSIGNVWWISSDAVGGVLLSEQRVLMGASGGPLFNGIKIVALSAGVNAFHIDGVRKGNSMRRKPSQTDERLKHARN